MDETVVLYLAAGIPAFAQEDGKRFEAEIREGSETPYFLMLSTLRESGPG